ncbi:MAG: hypothetical protein LBJ46_12050 [Planctomycetota bacterium]|jgi:hypothetical protein|nr:hypothetical protein [Planctomycetota bacterium]
MTDDAKTASDGGKEAAEPARKGSPWIASGLLAAGSFALAFALAWHLFGRPPAGPGAPPARDIAVAELAPFLEAARAGDYPRMAELGSALFTEGSRILGRETALDGYAVDGFPPHRVYAFYAAHKDGAVYRVLLTLDAEDRVASFLAEDMPVVD